jgi:RimJ/RimL family protein N-acetyltransferase
VSSHGGEPPSELRTERLVLRPLTLSLARAILAGDRGPGWAAGFPQEGDHSVASLLVAAAQASPTDVSDEAPSRWGAWTLTTHDGELIGTAGFHGPPREGEVEIGYGLAGEHRGRGLAGEAVAALLAFAGAQGVESAFAHVAPGNEASLRLLRRAGFHPAGRDERTGELVLRRAPLAGEQAAR